MANCIRAGVNPAITLIMPLKKELVHINKALLENRRVFWDADKQ
jgi:hypothetical protein